MKNKIAMVILIIFTVMIWTVLSVTETHSYKKGVGEGKGQRAYKKAVITQTGAPPADFNEITTPIFGVLDTIVIDSTGTDIDYDVIIKDENGFTIFSKTDCTSASEPYRYALSEADTAANDFRGVRVGGELTVSVNDGDDASLTAITIIIYYWQCWQ